LKDLDVYQAFKFSTESDAILRLMNKSSIDSVKVYVTELFVNNAKDYLVYHNLAHTETVVRRVEEIAAYYYSSKSDLYILLVAAWFHDTGHLFGPQAGHELKSVEIMRDYLSDLSESVLKKIEGCILATRLPARPGTLNEAIICDADLYHLGTDEFWESNEKVRKELEMRNGTVIHGWTDESIRLLSMHQYFTRYCRELLTPGKEKNIHWLRELINSGKSAF
jgi:predicted metal-dependent HD superfamily phosphohydrolase